MNSISPKYGGKEIIPPLNSISLKSSVFFLFFKGFMYPREHSTLRGIAPHLDGAKDFILQALVTYVEGQVYTVAGKGVYTCLPFSATENGQGVFPCFVPVSEWRSGQRLRVFFFF